MKIAIIDSGISANMDLDKIIQIRNYTNEEKYDLCGHGTNVFYLINSYKMESEYIIIKVLNENGLTKIKSLYTALNDLISEEIDIICMSLSIVRYDNVTDLKLLYEVCNTLCDSGVIFVCSYNNNSAIESFPASLEFIYGIKGMFFRSQDRFWYAKEKKDIVADIMPVCVRGLNNKREFFSGNSKACALMAGNILNNCKKASDVNDYLYNAATRHEWKDADIELDMTNYLMTLDVETVKFTAYEQKKIEKVFSPYFSDSFYGLNFLPDKKYYARMRNCETILSLAERNFNIKICAKDVYARDFINLDMFYKALKRWEANEEN